MSKITIPTEVWVELYAEFANWHVEESAKFVVCGIVWTKNENGDEVYTEEAQEKFNDAVDDVEKIMSHFFIKEGEE